MTCKLPDLDVGIKYVTLDDGTVKAQIYLNGKRFLYGKSDQMAAELEKVVAKHTRLIKSLQEGN